MPDKIGPSKGLLTKLIEFLGGPNPDVPTPVNTNMITNLGPVVDQASNYLEPKDKIRLQLLLDNKKVKTDWNMDEGVYGTWNPLRGIELSPGSTFGKRHPYDVAKTLAHEIQHSRQPFFGVIKSDIRLRPEGEKHDPYWDSRTEMDARAHAAELDKIWEPVDGRTRVTRKANIGPTSAKLEKLLEKHK